MESWLIRPGFVKAFHCIATDCEDSCCYNWSITIDKQSYRKTCQHPELRVKADSAMTKIKKDDAQWAVIKLRPDGGCPFLTDGDLCEIHAKGGHELLSHTCKTYPRLTRQQGSDKYESLSLSCPEAARCVLFYPDAFSFERLPSGKHLNIKTIPSWQTQTHHHAISLLLNPALSWEQALLAIGILTNTAETVKQGQADSNQIEQIATQLEQLIANDTLQQHFANFANDISHQEHAFVSTHKFLVTNAVNRGRQRFEQIHNAVLALTELPDGMNQLNKAWETVAKPALAEHPQLFHRYLFYYLYNMNFPAIEKLSPTDSFRLMVLDAFMLRCYLAALASSKGTLTQDDIVLCFQVYHTKRQHDKNFSRFITELLDEAGFTDVGAMISLLHTQYQ